MARPTAEMTAAAYDARSIFDVRPQVPSDDVVQDSITTQRSFEGEIEKGFGEWFVQSNGNQPTQLLLNRSLPSSPPREQNN